MLEESLKNKTVKGVGWSAIDNIVQHGITFLVGIILARLLTPDDYGLIGIIAIFTAISTALINGGFTTALIRKKDVTDDDYNTSFIVNLVVSIFLYAVIFFCAPLIADFFYRKELTALTQVASLGLIIGALAMVQQTRLTKRIDFKSQAKITIFATIVSGIISIVMAFVGFGVWSLVAQQLINQSLRTLLLWMVNKWIPKMKFSKESFYDLFGFGWKMMVSRLIDTVWQELYQVIIAKFYTPATLGQYTRSKQFSQLLSQNLSQVIQRVTYPVLSNIQDDKQRMVLAYRQIIKVTMFVSAVSMFFLGAVSEPLLYCLIGPQWHEAAIYLPLICINMSSYPLHAINLNMLQVQGRSDLFLGLEVIKKTIAIIPLSVGALVGIIPMLYVNIITMIINYFLNSYYSGKFIGYSSWMQIKDIAPSYGIAVIVASSVFFLKYLSISFWIVLPLQILVGGLSLILVCKISSLNEYNEIVEIVKTYYIKYKYR